MGDRVVSPTPLQLIILDGQHYVSVDYNTVIE